MYEPKWDGFRCIVFRDGDEIELGSRNERPLTRYFPELLEPLRAALPGPVRCVDGELVIATDHGLDFDLLSNRIHPAASRVNMLAEETPSSFVAFDLLADGRRRPARRSRSRSGAPRLEAAGRRPRLAGAPHAAHDASPRSPRDWFDAFEGAGLDGVVAKPLDGRTARASARC